MAAEHRVSAVKSRGDARNQRLHGMRVANPSSMWRSCETYLSNYAFVCSILHAHVGARSSFLDRLMHSACALLKRLLSAKAHRKCPQQPSRFPRLSNELSSSTILDAIINRRTTVSMIRVAHQTAVEAQDSSMFPQEACRPARRWVCSCAAARCVKNLGSENPT